MLFSFMSGLLYLSLLLFFLLLLFFFFSSFFSLFSLFLSFFFFFVFLFLLLNMNYLGESFEYFVYMYKFNFVNLVYCMSFDVMSLFFMLLCFLLLMVCLLLMWNLKYRLSELIFVLFLVNFLLLNVFCVLDLFFFYVFFEALLMPMFLLMGVWGSRERKVNAAYQFFLYTLVGSIFMLISIFFVYSHYGTTDSSLLYVYAASSQSQLIFWLSFFLAVSMKVPMFPVHIWLPEAHVEAPTAGSVILAGVLLKLGLYALLKFLFPIFPWGSVVFAPIVLVFGLMGMFYASCSTLFQVDMKKMVAYSSIAHMNFAVLGLFAFNFQGFLGSVCLMLGHGLVSSGLFLSVGFIYDSYKTRLFVYYGGLLSVMPMFAFLFFGFVLGNMSFPGTFNFVGEFTMFFGVILKNFFICLLAGFTMIMSAAYSLALYAHMALGEIKLGLLYKFSDLSSSEFFMLGVLLFLTYFFGVFSDFVFMYIEVVFPFYVDGMISLYKLF